jgi:O-antigen ligase
VEFKSPELRESVSLFIEINLLLIVFLSLLLSGAVKDIYWYPIGIWIVIVFCFSLFAWEKGLIAGPGFVGMEPYFLAFLVWMILSGALSDHRWMSTFALERLIAALLFFYLMLWHFRSKQREKAMLWSLFVFPALISLSGIILFLSNKTAFPPFFNQQTGLSGTFVNRNNFAGLVILGFFLGAGLIMSLHKVRNGFLSEGIARLAILSIPLIVLLIALGFSLSRGGWVAFSLSGAGFLLWLGLRSHRKKFKNYLALTLLVILAGIILTVLLRKSAVKERALSMNALFKDPASGLTLIGRKMIWKNTLAMIKEHPFFGVGPGNFGLEYPHHREPGDFYGERHAHNDLMQLAAEGGIPVALLALFILAKAFIIWRAKYRQEESRFRKRASIGIVFGMLGFLLQDQVDFHFYIPGLALYFLALAAFLIKPTRRAQA